MTQLVADISKWQAPIDPDKLSGMVDEIILRVCHGSLKDIQFEGYYGLLAPKGKPISGYVYVTTTSSASSQAGVFLAAISGKTIKYAVIDCEENVSGWSKSVLAAHYKAIIDAIKAARPDVEIVVYTRGEWWNTNVGNPSWASGYKLMIARYPIQHPWADDPVKYRPLPWLDYFMWQLFADGDSWGYAYGVSSDDIDISIINPYRVTPVAPPPPVVPPPDPLPVPTFPKPGTVSGMYGANLRTEPRVASDTLVKLLPKDTPVVLYAELPLTNNNEWYLVHVPSMANRAGWVAKQLVSAP